MTKYFPLFCTAQVPPTLIDDLLNKSEAGFRNIWTLVKTSSQKTFEKPTEPPVSDFTTSFTSANLDTLGEFCKNQAAGATMFGVLDERSINDSNVLLVKWEVWMDYINPNATSGLDDDSNLESHKGWETVRTSFGDAAYFMDSLQYLPVHEINTTNQWVDDNGVHLPQRSHSSRAYASGFRQVNEERRYLSAPTKIPSLDGIYDLGSICSTSQDIPKYFLFGGKLENGAKNLCNTALSYVDPASNNNRSSFHKNLASGVPKTLACARAVRSLPLFGTHGMNSTADSKEEASGLCTDALNYLGQTCLVGISGTGDGLHPTFQHESQKPGTITFPDKDGNLAIAFDFSLYGP